MSGKVHVLAIIYSDKGVVKRREFSGTYADTARGHAHKWKNRTYGKGYFLRFESVSDNVRFV